MRTLHGPILPEFDGTLVSSMVVLAKWFWFSVTIVTYYCYYITVTLILIDNLASKSRLAASFVLLGEIGFMVLLSS